MNDDAVPHYSTVPSIIWPAEAASGVPVYLGVYHGACFKIQHHWYPERPDQPHHIDVHLYRGHPHWNAVCEGSYQTDGQYPWLRYFADQGYFKRYNVSQQIYRHDQPREFVPYICVEGYVAPEKAHEVYATLVTMLTDTESLPLPMNAGEVYAILITMLTDTDTERTP
jgi:hypothetical protein